MNSEFWEYRFGGKKAYMMTNLRSQQNSVNHIFNQNEFFFFLLTGDKDITMLYTLFTGYEHDILRVISYLHFQRSKIGRKMDKFGRKSKKKGEFHEVHGVCFFQVC